MSSSTTSLDPVETRAALSRLPQVAAVESLAPPELDQVYVPEQHAKALSFDASLVVGMRGAGKSFWTAVLADDSRRGFVADLIGQPALKTASTGVAFGLSDSNDKFPSADVISSILSQGVEPYRIWQTVIIRHASNVLGLESPTPSDWTESVRWTMRDVERAERLLTTYDDKLAERSTRMLVLFDALDRVSAQNDWDEVRKLTKDALRLTLRCRSRRAIRLKIFLRPDLEEDEEIWSFPDSSKLRHGKVELAWGSPDLYGLILAHLANDSTYGASFRRFLTRTLGVDWKQVSNVFHPRFVSDQSKLRAVIEALADRYMGRDKRRGITFTWIPTHLMDAAGRISPRSYLLAFKRAAEMTDERYPNHLVALHHQALMDGVSAASEIRVQEIAEDYPWMTPLLEAARGISVPCSPEDLTQRWTDDCLRKVRAASKRRLPPRRFASSLRREPTEALMDDLVEIAVLYRTKDGRLNMPDIFRVGFGIKRRGGVKPPR